MSMEDRIDDTELHAYLDGELGEAERRAVETWLAAHPEDARRVAAWRAQNDALAGLGAEVFDQAPPERMTRTLDAAAVRPALFNRIYLYGSALMIVGVVLFSFSSLYAVSIGLLFIAGLGDGLQNGFGQTHGLESGGGG